MVCIRRKILPAEQTHCEIAIRLVELDDVIPRRVAALAAMDLDALPLQLIDEVRSATRIALPVQAWNHIRVRLLATPALDVIPAFLPEVAQQHASVRRGVAQRCKHTG